MIIILLSSELVLNTHLYTSLFLSSFIRTRPYIPVNMPPLPGGLWWYFFLLKMTGSLGFKYAWIVIRKLPALKLFSTNL